MKTIEKMMTKPAIATKADATATQVLFQILVGQYSGMPVIDDHSNVVGVVTELDLLKAIRAGKPLETTKVRDIMTASPITVTPSTDVEVVIDTMVQKGIIRIPVVENGKLIGIISRSDVLRAHHLPESVKYF